MAAGAGEEGGDDGPGRRHPPANFLPWLGYFDKIARADVFVVLDDVQFPKKGGTWVNRARLLVNGEPFWATIPWFAATTGRARSARWRSTSPSPGAERCSARLSRATWAGLERGGPLVAELVREPDLGLASYSAGRDAGALRATRPRC